MDLALVIAAGDFLTNVLDVLLSLIQRHGRGITPTAGPTYVIHNLYLLHNHYDAHRFTATTGTNTPIRRAGSGRPPPTPSAREC